MSFKHGAIISATFVVAVVIYNKSSSPTAMNCVAKEEDKNWSFLTFSNSCDTPISALFCQKMTLGEVGKMFGFQTGEWDCRKQYVAPKQSFATVKWVNEQSSEASWLMSSSRYQVAACKAGYTPRFTGDTEFACEK